MTERFLLTRIGYLDRYFDNGPDACPFRTLEDDAVRAPSLNLIRLKSVAGRT